MHWKDDPKRAEFLGVKPEDIILPAEGPIDDDDIDIVVLSEDDDSDDLTDLTASILEFQRQIDTLLSYMTLEPLLSVSRTDQTNVNIIDI